MPGADKVGVRSGAGAGTVAAPPSVPAHAAESGAQGRLEPPQPPPERREPARGGHVSPLGRLTEIPRPASRFSLADAGGPDPATQRTRVRAILDRPAPKGLREGPPTLHDVLRSAVHLLKARLELPWDQLELRISGSQVAFIIDGLPRESSDVDTALVLFGPEPKEVGPKCWAPLSETFGALACRVQGPRAAEPPWSQTVSLGRDLQEALDIALLVPKGDTAPRTYRTEYDAATIQLDPQTLEPTGNVCIPAGLYPAETSPADILQNLRNAWRTGRLWTPQPYDLVTSGSFRGLGIERPGRFLDQAVAQAIPHLLSLIAPRASHADDAHRLQPKLRRDQPELLRTVWACAAWTRFDFKGAAAIRSYLASIFQTPPHAVEMAAKIDWTAVPPDALAHALARHEVPRRPADATTAKANTGLYFAACVDAATVADDMVRCAPQALPAAARACALLRAELAQPKMGPRLLELPAQIRVPLLEYPEIAAVVLTAHLARPGRSAVSAAEADALLQRIFEAPERHGEIWPLLSNPLLQNADRPGWARELVETRDPAATKQCLRSLRRSVRSMTPEAWRAFLDQHRGHPDESARLAVRTALDHIPEIIRVGWPGAALVGPVLDDFCAHPSVAAHLTSWRGAIDTLIFQNGRRKVLYEHLRGLDDDARIRAAVHHLLFPAPGTAPRECMTGTAAIGLLACNEALIRHAADQVRNGETPRQDVAARLTPFLRARGYRPRPAHRVHSDDKITLPPRRQSDEEPALRYLNAALARNPLPTFRKILGWASQVPPAFLRAALESVPVNAATVRCAETSDAWTVPVQQWSDSMPLAVAPFLEALAQEEPLGPRWRARLPRLDWDRANAADTANCARFVLAQPLLPPEIVAMLVPRLARGDALLASLLERMAQEGSASALSPEVLHTFLDRLSPSPLPPVFFTICEQLVHEGHAAIAAHALRRRTSSLSSAAALDPLKRCFADAAFRQAWAAQMTEVASSLQPGLRVIAAVFDPEADSIKRMLPEIVAGGPAGVLWAWLALALGGPDRTHLATQCWAHIDAALAGSDIAEPAPGLLALAELISGTENLDLPSTAWPLLQLREVEHRTGSQLLQAISCATASVPGLALGAYVHGVGNGLQVVLPEHAPIVETLIRTALDRGELETTWRLVQAYGHALWAYAKRPEVFAERVQQWALEPGQEPVAQPGLKAALRSLSGDGLLEALIARSVIAPLRDFVDAFDLDKLFDANELAPLAGALSEISGWVVGSEKASAWAHHELERIRFAFDVGDPKPVLVPVLFAVASASVQRQPTLPAVMLRERRLIESVSMFLDLCTVLAFDPCATHPGPEPMWRSEGFAQGARFVLGCIPSRTRSFSYEEFACAAIAMAVLDNVELERTSAKNSTRCSPGYSNTRCFD